MTTSSSSNAVVLGRRRFQVLSPTLVRVEYSPDGGFEDRPSMVAAGRATPLPCQEMGRKRDWDVFDTGCLEIWTRENDRPCDRRNLELRWSDKGFRQFWRPGDRDYQNLGGTLRSLDRYSGEACALDGVHPAGMESPDTIGSTWIAWTQDEVDPLYTALHPAPPEPRGHATWLKDATEPNAGRIPERSYNLHQEARKFPPGLLSKAGYFFLNDSEAAVLNERNFPVEREVAGRQDWYFFAYGSDYKQALADFRLLSGATPLPPRKNLGIVFSRWPAFTEKEIEEIAASFRANGYPLSTLVMDMEWHKEGWGHWEFDPNLIPDPRRFFARCRELGLDVTLNDHPLDVREDDKHFEEYVKRCGPGVEVREREYKGRTVRMASVNICDEQQNRAFREICHAEIWEAGLDYWWNDGSRGQMRGTLGQLVSNKSFFEDSVRDGRRGMHLARYGGLGSHRYGAFFTGDANSDYDVLRLQCEFNIRAAGSGISLISHDIGGFSSTLEALRTNPDGETIIDPALYLRWLQFGVFNPVLRLHSAPWAGSRRPEHYDRELGGVCRHWLRMRHSLLPYLYSAMWECHQTGVPVTRGLFLESPDDAAGYRFDQFFFGASLLVAPMLSAADSRTLYLPAVPGGWWEFETGRQLAGGGEITRTVPLAEVPVYVRAGSILPRQDPDGPIHPGHIEALILDVFPGADGAGVLYEDDGVSDDYCAGRFCRTEFTLRQESGGVVVSAKIGEGMPLGSERSVTIEISLSFPPSAVRLNSGEELSWEKLPIENRYRIILPKRTSASPWSLRIEEAKF